MGRGRFIIDSRWYRADLGAERPNMTTLVTGGGGFLGSAIVRRLVERGCAVAVLGRGEYPHLRSLGVKCIRGDIRGAATVHEACRGVDTVFHVAALAGVWGRRREFEQINITGTRNVLAACRASGVGKLVLTSSPSVVFGAAPLCGVDESQPYPDRYLADYPRTKAVAEREVLAANGGDLATVAIRPHLIWGPGDPHIIPRIIDRARTGRLVQVGDGTNFVDITYIDNAADAHILAADALKPGAACSGGAYFISQGEPVSLWPWIRGLLDKLGIPGSRRSLSLATAYRIGALMEFAHRGLPFLGEPRLTRFVAMQLGQSHYFDISAARRDLGYIPRVGTDEGVETLVRSLRGARGA